jgi:hypothetical protein
MAFADGELDAPSAAAVERLVALDPHLAQRIEMFRQTRRLAREAWADPLGEPIPDRLLAPLRRPWLRLVPQVASRRVVMAVAAPLAASLILIGGLGGYLVGRDSAVSPAMAIQPLILGPTLTRALDQALAGEVVTGPRGERAKALATFTAGDAVCRTYDVVDPTGEDVKGISCYKNGQWEIELAERHSVGSSDDYSPASASSGSIDAYLAHLGADQPVDAETERQLRMKAWRP